MYMYIPKWVWVAEWLRLVLTSDHMSNTTDVSLQQDNQLKC
jgi:hypothetical protein